MIKMKALKPVLARTEGASVPKQVLPGGEFSVATEAAADVLVRDGEAERVTPTRVRPEPGVEVPEPVAPSPGELLSSGDMIEPANGEMAEGIAPEGVTLPSLDADPEYAAGVTAAPKRKRNRTRKR